MLCTKQKVNAMDIRTPIPFHSLDLLPLQAVVSEQLQESLQCPENNTPGVLILIEPSLWHAMKWSA